MKRSRMIVMTILATGLGFSLTLGAWASETVKNNNIHADKTDTGVLATKETIRADVANSSRPSWSTSSTRLYGATSGGIEGLLSAFSASVSSGLNLASHTVRENHEDPGSSPWRPGTRGEKVLPDPVFPGASPCEGRDLLYRRHVDATYATYEPGNKLALKVVDGSDVRDSNEVCIHLPYDGANHNFGGIRTGDEISRMVVPDDPDWRFLGNPGAIVWKAPQTYLDAGPVWAGIGAFDSAHEWKVPTDIDEGLVTLKLVEVETPSQHILKPGQNGGEEQVNLFIESFEKPSINAISTNLGIWEYRAAVKAHTHITWTFSAPGYWRLQWVASAKINGKEVTSAPMDQLWAVGTNQDLLWKEKRLPGVYPVNRTAEQIRADLGLSAPENNGFDWHGKAGNSSHYEVAEQCEKLQAPVKPVPDTTALSYPVEKYLNYLREELFGWGSKPEPFSIQNYQWVFWTDPLAYSPYGMRGRLFNEKASAEEKKQVLQPLGEDSYEQDTTNSYYGYSQKIILVPDTYLSSYQPGTFAKTGAWASLVEHDTVYAFDARNANDPKISFELLPDAERGLQSATVYIDGLSTGTYLGNETAQPVFGEFSENSQGSEELVLKASGLDSNRTAFQLKPGEALPLSLVFAKPGASSINITVTPNYAQEQNIAPLQMEWKFIVGNQAIRQYYQEKGESVPDAYREDGTPRLSPAFYKRYEQDLQAYKNKLAQCKAEKDPDSKPQPDDKDHNRGENLPDIDKHNNNSGNNGTGTTPKDKNVNNGDGSQKSAVNSLEGAGNSFTDGQVAVLNNGSLLTQWQPSSAAPVATPPAVSEKETKELKLDTADRKALNNELQIPKEATKVSKNTSMKWAYILLTAGGVAALAGVGLLGYAIGLSRKRG